MVRPIYVFCFALLMQFGNSSLILGVDCPRTWFLYEMPMFTAVQKKFIGMNSEMSSVFSSCKLIQFLNFFNSQKNSYATFWLSATSIYLVRRCLRIPYPTSSKSMLMRAIWSLIGIGTTSIVLCNVRQCRLSRHFDAMRNIAKETVRNPVRNICSQENPELDTQKNYSRFILISSTESSMPQILDIICRHWARPVRGRDDPSATLLSRALHDGIFV